MERLCIQREYLVVHQLLYLFYYQLYHPQHENPLINTDIDSNNRYIRLVLRDGNGADGGLLRDSNVGSGAGRHNTATTNSLPSDITTYTQVPIDFSEWFFIVASFNPYIDNGDGTWLGVNEDGSNFDSTDPDYWRNNVDVNGNYVVNSGLGAMCKVEVISRSDLLRARGFQV